MRFGAPEPLVIWAQLHAAGSNLAVCLRAGPKPLGTVGSREGRASVCNQAVERRFRAISALLRMGDSDFGVVKARFLEIETMAT